MRNNPLLHPSSLRYGAPLFDKIREDDYLPAFRKAIEQAYKDVDAITSNPEPPTFENTIEALEFSGKLLDEVSGIFFNLNECLSSDKMQGIAEEISPELTRLSLYTLFNDKLFQRIKTVYEQRNKLHLDKEQARLLEKRFRAFKENGALLDEEGKKHLAKNSEEASLLTLKFGKNVQAALAKLKGGSKAEGKNKSGGDFVFVVNDAKTYTSLSDFQKPKARQLASSWAEARKMYASSLTALSADRDAWAAADKAGKEKLGPKILSQEKVVESMKANITKLEKMARAEELGK